VNEPAYGFFIAGSSLEAMNGVYIRRVCYYTSSATADAAADTSARLVVLMLLLLLVLLVLVVLVLVLVLLLLLLFVVLPVLHTSATTINITPTNPTPLLTLPLLPPPYPPPSQNPPRVPVRPEAPPIALYYEHEEGGYTMALNSLCEDEEEVGVNGWIDILGIYSGIYIYWGVYWGV
jgi:hypothetical protein